MVELDFGIAYKNKIGNAIKVTVNEFRGQIYCHIREYGYDGDDERWYPTKKGIALLAEEVDTVIWLLESVSQELAKPYKFPLQLEFEFNKETDEY